MGVAADGGEHLAPVIPLFGSTERGAGPGRRDARPTTETAPTHPTERVSRAGSAPAGAPSADAAVAEGVDSREAAAERWHTTWRDLGRERTRPTPAPDISTVERGGVRLIEVNRGAPAVGGPDEALPDPADAAARAERKLLRSLASRGLSVSEARTKLRQQDVPAELIDEILERLGRTGALDDARLAEQLVHSATSRKKQGRRAVAQSLSARGIPRDIVDAALADVADDDAERAVEFARTKAGQLARYDDDTALRRLVGQLARRGFGGSLAMSAARRALDEARRPAGGVRFE